MKKTNGATVLRTKPAGGTIQYSILYYSRSDCWRSQMLGHQAEMVRCLSSPQMLQQLIAHLLYIQSWSNILRCLIHFLMTSVP